MELTRQDLEDLTNVILQKIREEFDAKHMSGNLMNTIEVQSSDDGIQIIIPAQTYNMLLFQNKGVVVHTSNGSYASKLDEEGSEFYVYPSGTRKGAKRIKPGNHKDFVNRVINEAVSDWMTRQGRFDEKKITEF